MSLLDDLTTMDAIEIRKEFDNYEDYQTALFHAFEMFRDFQSETKDRIKAMGGYISIIDWLDSKFSRPGSLVQTVDMGFHQLFSLPSVKGDPTGHRHKIMDRYDHDRQKFRYDSDFAAAYDFVIKNKSELNI